MTNYISEINFIMDPTEENLIEAISSILDTNDTFSTTLNESISFEFEEYYPLIEAVNTFQQIKNSLQLKINGVKKVKSDAERVVAIKAATSCFGDLIEWWYKVEPEKKFATFHAVLKFGAYLINMIVKFLVSSKVAKGISKALDVGSGFNVKIMLIRMVSGFITDKLISSLLTISKSTYLEVNAKDLDKNIKSLQKSLKIYDNLIAKEDDAKVKDHLEVLRTKSYNALMELEHVKIDLKKKNRETK